MSSQVQVQSRVFNFAFFTHFSLPQVYVQRLDSWRV
jgi:hypothetical protein